MPRWINEDCIACGSCQAECPVECISEGDIYSIDEGCCIDCGACEEVCPVGAISEKWKKAHRCFFYCLYSFIN